jgi:hypothetical protein
MYLEEIEWRSKIWIRITKFQTLMSRFCSCNIRQRMPTCLPRGNKANSFVNNFNNGFINQLTERDELIYKKFWERKMCHVLYKIKMSNCNKVYNNL